MGRPRHCCAELNTSRIAYKPVFTAPWKVVLSWSLDGISPHYKPILVQIVEVPSHLPVRDMLLKIHEQFPDLPVSEWTSIFYSLLVFGGFDWDGNESAVTSVMYCGDVHLDTPTCVKMTPGHVNLTRWSRDHEGGLYWDARNNVHRSFIHTLLQVRPVEAAVPETFSRYWWCSRCDNQ